MKVIDAGPAASAASTEHGLRILGHLKRTKPWVTLVGVLGLVFGGLQALSAVVSFTIAIVQRGGGAGDGNAWAGMPANLGYLAGSAVFILLAGRIVGYGRRIGLALQTGRTAHVEEALDAQRRVWKTFGVFAIFIAGLALIVLAGGAIVSLIVSLS
jgi:hypothetical protein